MMCHDNGCVFTQGHSIKHSTEYVNPVKSAYYRTKYQEQKARAIAYLGGKCVACGSTERLHFDHKDNDREGHRNCLAQLLKCSWDRVLVELQKCQLLCAVCHGRKSNQERGNRYQAVHGTVTYYTHQKCRCDDCRAAMALYARNHRKAVPA